MAFNFGFVGDDIDNDIASSSSQQAVAAAGAGCANIPPSALPGSLELEMLLARLPSKIAWTVVTIQSQDGSTLLLPRRELFDVRMQLMAEEDSLDISTDRPGLDNADIRTNIYEGGFKSWECSFDLANLLLKRGPKDYLDGPHRIGHVVELGCGTAIPSSVLFQYAVTQKLPTHFTFTDYNADVLELVTFPNLFLTWASTLVQENTNDSRCGLSLSEGATGDLDVTPELKASFLQALVDNGQHLKFVSGSWSPVMVWGSMVPKDAQIGTLVLASETIYSPAALQSFTTALTYVLNDAVYGEAIVSAKRIYFGVGGSVDAFKAECAAQGAVCEEIVRDGIDLAQDEGVRRCLLEVKMRQ